MNVFVLNTGRCGSATFIKACEHITNFSAGHETRSRLLGAARLAFPANHIEADNRLSWFLGRLHGKYGDNAFYVHLRRSDADTARSFANRYDNGIMVAYRNGILKGVSQSADPLEVSLDYCDTVNRNVEHFLEDKSDQMAFTLENAKKDFRRFWLRIGAEGDLEAALGEWDVAYNSTRERAAEGSSPRKAGASPVKQIGHAIKNSPIVAIPRRALRHFFMRGPTGQELEPGRQGLIVAACAITLVAAVIDVVTTYNFTVAYTLAVLMLAAGRQKASWPLAIFMALLIYAGYFVGPWPESAHNNWGLMFFSHRMIKRTCEAGVVLAVTALAARLFVTASAAAQAGRGEPASA